MDKLVIATRGSKLALWQAEHIKARLQEEHRGLAVELLKIKTTGDKILDVPLAQVGGKGLFVKEIEEAMLDGRANIAVHSMKDVPTELPEGLVVDVIPEREDCTDTLLMVEHPSLAELPMGAKVGTSSLRRQAQIKLLRPDLEIESLRGNLDTRVRKLMEGLYDAIVVATAGLKRLGLSAPRSEVLAPPRFLPAVAQGALGIEYARDNREVSDIIEFLNHQDSFDQVEGERGFLTGLDGGCQVPIASASELSGDTITVTGLVSDLEGRRVIRLSRSGPRRDARGVGSDLAIDVLDAGAREILDELYGRPAT